jgi:hypothetical protein
MFMNPQAPVRRFHVGRLLALVSLMLVATACSLNQSPEGERVGGGPPVVRLASPMTNATYLEGVQVNIQASVTNAGEDIDRVEVTVDNAVVTTLPQPNASGSPIFSVSHTWPAAGTGSHTIGVTAFRGDGTASAPATVTISVISPAPATETTAPTLEPSDAPTQEDDTPTDEGGDEQPTDEDSGDEGDSGDDGGDEDDGSGPPTATFTQGVNVRRGPSTNFNPPIGSFAANQTAEIVGINPAGDWYKVRYYNSDGWVFASLMTISGDTSNLPVDPGPPTPVPATATPIPPTSVPATAVPVSQANLVAGNIRLDPSQPTCGETFEVRVDIANLGSSDTTTTGLFTVEDSAGGNVTRTQGPIPIVKAGETVGSADIPITVSTNYNEEHTLAVILNPTGSIPETGSGDNRREIKYTLQRGGC